MLSEMIMMSLITHLVLMQSNYNIINHISYVAY